MTCNNNKQIDEVRRKMADIAFKMFEMQVELSERLWDIFAQEFTERICNTEYDRKKYIDESQIPF